MLIYLAGPMTLGNHGQNLRQATETANVLHDLGHAVIVPQLSYLWDFLEHKTHEEWLRIDKRLIEHCDAVVRLPGESRGADEETKYAGKIGVRVWQGLESFLDGSGHGEDHDHPGRDTSGAGAAGEGE